APSRARSSGSRRCAPRRCAERSAGSPGRRRAASWCRQSTSGATCRGALPDGVGTRHVRDVPRHLALLAETDGSGGPLRERLVDGRADGAARVAPASEVAAEPAYGRLAVHARQLTRPLARELARTGQLVTRVDQIEGVLDRRRRQQPPGELGSDRRAAERLAFLKRRDQVLREGGVVDEPDQREAVALARDTRLVDPAVTQQTLDLAAGVRTTPERLHRDALRVGGEVALRVAQARAAVIDLRAPRVIPLQLVGLGDLGRIVVAGGGRGRRPCAEQVADGREPAVGLIHGGSPSRVLLARGLAGGELVSQRFDVRGRGLGGLRCRTDAELHEDLLLDLVRDVGVLQQERAGVLLALPELVTVVGVPGARLAHDLV